LDAADALSLKSKLEFVVFVFRQQELTGNESNIEITRPAQSARYPPSLSHQLVSFFFGNLFEISFQIHIAPVLNFDYENTWRPDNDQVNLIRHIFCPR